MKSFIKKTAAILLISIITLPTLSFESASAKSFTNKKGTITVTCGSYKKKFTAKKYKNNFTKAFKKALDEARKKAKNNKKATVKISKGNYILSETLLIYSNTVLDARGSTLRSKKGNHLKNGFDKKKSSAKGYSGARNITVIGGLWDANVPYKNADKTARFNGDTVANAKYTNSSLRFGHCKNITIKNAEFKNNYNAHDIELGGVDGAKVTNCKFYNSKDMNSLDIIGGVEAVQIDVNTQKAVDHFPSYDGTACRNVTVSGNSFVNKYRAIGSHHSVLGKPYKNITVCNNKINNCAGIAINAVYWVNSKIYNNTMTDVGSGIDFYSVADHNVYNISKMSRDSVENSVKSSKTYVYNNKVNVRATPNLLTYQFGIRVSGSEVEEVSNITPPKGTYHLYNASVGINEKGNSAPNYVTGSFRAGVAANYCVNSVMANNIVDLSDCNYPTSNALFVSYNTNTPVKNNKVTISDDSVNNTVIPAETTGINTAAEPSVPQDSTEPTVQNGTEPAAEEAVANVRNGMSLRGCVDTEVSGNDIKADGYGIQMIYGPTGTYIHDNIINSLSLSCVYLSGRDDPAPDIKKTLTVINNKLKSMYNTAKIRESSAVHIIRSNVDVTAHSNTKINDSDEDIRYYIMGASKVTSVGNEIELPELKAEKVEEGINLSWNKTTASGYKVSCFVNDAEIYSKITTDCFYNDDFITADGYEVYYTVTPYVVSENITLYSKPVEVRT